jgi:hypothetical protein
VDRENSAEAPTLIFKGTVKDPQFHFAYVAKKLEYLVLLFEMYKHVYSEAPNLNVCYALY